MDFFKHSTTGRYSPALKKLEQQYGLGGLGFYWKAVELICHGNGVASFGALLALRYKPLRYCQVEKILTTSELFVFDETEATVSLNESVMNGVGTKINHAFSGVRTEAHTEARTNAGGGVHAKACTEVGTEARTDASRRASAGAVPLLTSSRKEVDKEIEGERYKGAPPQVKKEIEIEKRLMEYMATRCPVLLEMPEPLTLDQYLDLKRRFTRNEIERVLLDMQNDIKISQYRSCYATALKWLERRRLKPL